MSLKALFPWMTLALAAASVAPVAAQSANDPTALEVVRELVGAFNRHDPDAMAQLVTDDFDLYYVDGEGASVLSAHGPDQLRSEMTLYFEARPNVRSEVLHAIPGLNYVAFREQVVGGESSIAVYEVRGAKVRRTWYYPAEPGG